MRFFIVFFLFSAGFLFSQKYNFSYELDYKKAVDDYRRVGVFRIGLNSESPVLQIFKPNEHYFAAIWDTKEGVRHYFYYQEKRRGEVFKYIGTVKMNDSNPLKLIQQIDSKEYPSIDYLVFLELETRISAFYVNLDAIDKEANKKNRITYRIKKVENDLPPEIPLNLAIRKNTEIVLPEKLIHIPFSSVQDLMKCVITRRYESFGDIGKTNKSTLISNTCD